MVQLYLLAMFLQNAQPQGKQMLGMPLWIWWVVAAVLFVLYLMRRNARKAKAAKKL